MTRPSVRSHGAMAKSKAGSIKISGQNGFATCACLKNTTSDGGNIQTRECTQRASFADCRLALPLGRGASAVRHERSSEGGPSSLMRGAKTLSSLAVEVFIEEERIPPDRVLLEAELALLGDRDTGGPVGRGGLRPRARLCAQQSVSAHGFPLNRGVSNG